MTLPRLTEPRTEFLPSDGTTRRLEQYLGSGTIQLDAVDLARSGPVVLGCPGRTALLLVRAGHTMAATMRTGHPTSMNPPHPRIRLLALTGAVLLMSLAACSAAEPASDDVAAVATSESAPVPTPTATDTAPEPSPAVATATSESSGGHAAHDATEAGPAEDADTLDVAMVDIAFDPPAIEVVAGHPTALTVRNDGVLEHDFDLPAADLHVHAMPGEEKSATLQIDAPGTYEARCLIEGHAEAGMVMAVTVR